MELPKIKKDWQVIGTNKNNLQEVDELSVVFLKSYKKKNLCFPENKYLSMAPFKHEDKPFYLETEFTRKDTLTYMKHRNEDKWLYEDKQGQLDFSFLRRYRNGFVPFQQPMVLFVMYLEEPTFLLYTQRYFGTTKTYYLIYFEAIVQGTKHILMAWSENPYDATIFRYRDPSLPNEWKHFINHNIPGKTYYTGYSKEYDYYFYREIPKPPKLPKISPNLICEPKVQILDFSTKLIKGLYYPKPDKLWWKPAEQWKYPQHYIECNRKDPKGAILRRYNENEPCNVYDSSYPIL